MRCVLDASVAVAAAHPSEPTYAAALARVTRFLDGRDELVAPILFRIEVAAALSRTGSPARVADAYVSSLVAPPARLLTIGPRAARAIQRIATQLKLRAADAAYVWVASRERVPLITSDGDVVARAGAVCHVEVP